MREDLYRRSLFFGLPDDEKIEFLEKLVTDPRMKAVWEALARRVTEEKEYLRYVHACEYGIVGWRATHKLTATEHKKYYQEIYDCAAKLNP